MNLTPDLKRTHAPPILALSLGLMLWGMTLEAWAIADEGANMRLLSKSSELDAVYNVQSGSEPQTARPPSVLIVRPRYPSQGGVIHNPAYARIKASVDDPEGQIAEVRFFADTNLIGVATNTPFTIGWFPPYGSGSHNNFTLTAVAVARSGLMTTSAPVVVLVSNLSLPTLESEFTSPENGTMLPSASPFQVSTEALITDAEGAATISMRLYSGSNLLQTLTQPDKTVLPFIFTVTNLSAGNHVLTAELIQGDQACFNVTCPKLNIRVVDLGLKSIRVDSRGAAQIEVVTAFPGKQTVIQATADEFTWVSLSTNVPSTNFFQFTDPNAKNFPRRYYRALVLP